MLILVGPGRAPCSPARDLWGLDWGLGQDLAALGGTGKPLCFHMRLEAKKGVSSPRLL